MILEIQILLYMFTIIQHEVIGWNFIFMGLEESDVRISRISIWGTRAYLCIPRVNADQPVTLGEVPWPEGSLQTPFNTKPYPNKNLQEIGNCNNLQSAVASDIDAKGRLYVLDQGFGNCGPKIIIYDVRINKEQAQIELEGVPAGNLSSIMIEADPYTSVIRGYIGDTGGNSMIVFNPRNLCWWKLILNVDVNSISDVDVEDDIRIGTSQMTLSRRDSVLYVASFDTPNLYSLDLNQLKNMDEPRTNDTNRFDYDQLQVSTNFEGMLFGKSYGIFADSMGGLNYIYDKDNVILRWNTRYPLEDTYTDVLLQNYPALLHAVQIFTDGYQMWAINSKPNDYQQHTVKVKKFYV